MQAVNAQACHCDQSYHSLPLTSPAPSNQNILTEVADITHRYNNYTVKKLQSIIVIGKLTLFFNKYTLLLER